MARSKLPELRPELRPELLTERCYCVVMHDVAPATWSKCQRLLAALREVASFPATLLLVPHYHHGEVAAAHPEFCRAMADCQSAGDELVLHGLYHQDDAPTVGAFDLIKRHYYTASEGEFATLSKHEAARRIDVGLRWFEEEGFKASGFVAPAWLASEGTWQALDDTGLKYSTTLSTLKVLHGGPLLRAQSLVFSSRSAWRRVASHAVAEIVASRLRRAPLVRFGLHPIDADYKNVVRHWQSLLERFAKSHQPTTKSAFVERLGAR
jgi:predicted deacetylase